jgi:mRNA-degrading endonuclease RelE of RelBE toxin-antitoxin system
MSYSLIVTDTFLNQLLGLPQNLSKQITKKLKVLQEKPDSANGDAKKIKGRDNLYRVSLF